MCFKRSARQILKETHSCFKEACWLVELPDTDALVVPSTEQHVISSRQCIHWPLQCSKYNASQRHALVSALESESSFSRHQRLISNPRCPPGYRKKPGIWDCMSDTDSSGTSHWSMLHAMLMNHALHVWQCNLVRGWEMSTMWPIKACSDPAARL